MLLPMTSLPSRFGIGDMGPGALRFAEFLQGAGQSLWQVLPLTATDAGCAHSPYSPASAFAGSGLLISPEGLMEDGFLSQEDLDSAPNFSNDRVDYGAAGAFKAALLQKVWAQFHRGGESADFKAFCQSQGDWLEDWSLFISIKGAMGGLAWRDWPDGLKFRRPQDLDRFRRDHDSDIGLQNFIQYVFARQMSVLRRRMAELKLELVGDVPVYVMGDCADVWAHPDLFDLDEDLNFVSVAGVPPDYFSAKGQLWGNPTYNWEAMRRDGFRWWTGRLRRLLTFFDRVRIDHFRGLIAYWALPADAETAEHGEWRSVPHREFFSALRSEFPDAPFWAENLGILTPEVEEARTAMGLPGMTILHFAFGHPADNPYAPHNHTPKTVVYTGTHDNNTSRGWLMADATPWERANLSAYLGCEVTAGSVSGAMTRMALASVAETAVIPMQDWLDLGPEARINTPSTTSGNWTWRMKPDAVTPDLTQRMRSLCALYGRTGA